ncbi:hypothetical protein AG1IA_06598 [Rhizoctonia solani AG-1 IA]|uniref:Uncharacterized protein n=1 Tax=Thanatephorus cucumeris (strain AG1-IA) TaxID=983506 RepID=L8WMK5_THACA|nr:hypothetical protein AG1IA_06598 [Rhizoctonia solani AG-1 IA]
MSVSSRHLDSFLDFLPFRGTTIQWITAMAPVYMLKVKIVSPSGWKGQGLATLGLLYLQAHHARYHLDAADRQTISEVLELYPRPIGQAASIYTLPLGFDMYAAHAP